ncbi:hypothetical protein [Brevibacillus brevis]|uniref:hypothetical protein n=1 Tax=Brevibacillus brevis TaxID=1393 RepID=UPI000D112259|nr:hypothetical protein [Brevibacillus brevis]PSJ67440.1 hypothetical protein C7J99_20835 [Brevibacillus brevis]RED28424.1 hypothetical protein DES34_108291 [Brevibacillus brevis]GEC90678.1 hypothetical protein BBR01nite_30090 [Brevibacillus brevis]VEF91119.1 Uncharacterised protein [Brevibacillus brevis]
MQEVIIIVKKAIIAKLLALPKYACIGAFLTITMKILDFLGLYSIEVLKVGGAAIALMFLDFYSKKYQYFKHFGSIKKAEKAGAWRSEFKRLFTAIKLLLYLIYFLAAILLIAIVNEIQMISIDLNGFIIAQEQLVMCVLLCICSIEFDSIKENLTTEISEKEKKRWANSEEYINRVMSESEKGKLEMISTIVYLGIDRLFALLKGLKRKGGDKDGK